MLAILAYKHMHIEIVFEPGRMQKGHDPFDQVHNIPFTSEEALESHKCIHNIRFLHVDDDDDGRKVPSLRMELHLWQDVFIVYSTSEGASLNGP